jgi:hypothetical protein
MKNSESAFPVLDSYAFEGGGSRLDCVSPGLSLKQYAAIRLKVPCSGDPELDAAIRQSRRAEFAKAALAGNVFGSSVHDCQGVAEECFDVANYMLAEWEKEAGK